LPQALEIGRSWLVAQQGVARFFAHEPVCHSSELAPRVIRGAATEKHDRGDSSGYGSEQRGERGRKEEAGDGDAGQCSGHHREQETHPGFVAQGLCFDQSPGGLERLLATNADGAVPGTDRRETENQGDFCGMESAIVEARTADDGPDGSTFG